MKPIGDKMKKKNRRKCSIHTGVTITTCIDCDFIEFVFSENEIEDIHSALEYCVSNNFNSSIAGRKNMLKIIDKILEMKSMAEGEKNDQNNLLKLRSCL